MSPTSTLEIRRAERKDDRALAQMLELYQYELSDIWDQDLDENGAYGYDLARFTDDPNCYACIALIDGKYAGFALVDQAVKIGSQGYWMDQFFILKKYRGNGIGTRLARHTFTTLPGDWEVGQMPENHAARDFWQRAISQFTHGKFTQHQVTEGWWQGSVHCFQS
jgi:predicted acetyltransferase